MPPSRDLEPLLLTALGDLFLQASDHSVLFLDSTSGTLISVAPDRTAWKRELQTPERLTYWFQPGFVAALLGAGYTLEQGEVFSPSIPPVLGGKQTPGNYSPTPWLLHFHVLGQIHRQVTGLPPGTPITSVTFTPF